MKKKQQSTDRKRRRFLRDTAMASAGFAAAVALPGLATTAVSSESDAPTDAAQSQKGYRLTPHIAEYYKTLTS